MTTIEIEAAQRDLPTLCLTVARTGRSIVVTRGQKALVSIVPLHPAPDESEPSVWELRRQFERRHGVLTDDFDLPLRAADESRWENPLKD